MSAHGAIETAPLRILRMVHTLRGESGGPTESVRRSTEALARLGHVVDVATLDGPKAGGDVPGARVVQFLGDRLGPARGYAATSSLIPWLRSCRDRYDAVLVHGLWQYQGWGTRQALLGTGKPWLVFPHGMLDPWFRRAYPIRHFKKQLYWWWRERRVLGGAAAVCFTCEEERRLARGSFWPYRVQEQVVAYGTADPAGDPASQAAAWASCCPQLEGRPYLLFLGRLHPKKGLDLLIRSYAARRAMLPGAPALVVAGPGTESAHGRSMQALAAATCPPNSVHWAGMVEGDAKWGALRGCEALVLPSYQENFGIAVVEAMACARPVLISRQINIWREIVADGAGLAEPADEKGAAALLMSWATMDTGKRRAMGEAARRSFLARFEADRAARSLAGTIRHCLEQAGRPLRAPA
jgi:glycosyltransferase involved in cell wall biosynthesis